MKRRAHRFDPDGQRLPVKLDEATNAEFAPLPLEPQARLANRMAQDRATEHARRLGLSRRDFMISAAGTATTLLALNEACAAAGSGEAYRDLCRINEGNHCKSRLHRCT